MMKNSTSSAIPLASPQSQPVLGVDADLQTDEARGQGSRHAVDYAAVPSPGCHRQSSDAPSGNSYSPTLRSSTNW